MSLEGFVCDVTELRVSCADCLACARKGALAGCHMTAPVVRGIVAGQRPDDYGLTITPLLGCPRKWRLERETSYFVKPSEAWWAFRGQLMHSVIESFVTDDPAAIAERRFRTRVEAPGGEQVEGRTLLVEISGQPDLVYPDRRHLIDFKTTKSVPKAWYTCACPETGEVLSEGPWSRRGTLSCSHCSDGHEARSVQARGAPRPYAEHVTQVSLYRLLLADNGIEVDSAEIVYQDMGGQLRLMVELLSLDDARALLESRLALFVQPDLPDVLREPSQLWRCDYCPVRAHCEELHGGPVGKGADLTVCVNGDA